jgi:MazG family protein
MNLKIIGLGIFSGDMSVRGSEAVKKADCVILKSEKFKSAKIISGGIVKKGAEFFILDGFFENAEDFDDLNEKITEFVAEKSREYKNSVYLVNGSGNDDATAAALLRLGAEFIPAASGGAYAVAAVMREEGKSFRAENKSENGSAENENEESTNASTNEENTNVNKNAESKKIDGNTTNPNPNGNESEKVGNKNQNGGENENENARNSIEKNIKNLFSLYAAAEITARELNDTDCLFPDKRFCFVVKDIYDAFTASDVKLKLSDIYGDAEVFLVRGEDAIKTTLFEIDRQKTYDYRTVLIIPPSEFTANKVHDLADLYLVMKRLRAPNGCKWDMAQNHKSIAINAIEEAYELVDAIDLLDRDKILEESGDVLLQAMFHAVIAEDEGDFTVYDMLTSLCEKLIFRHTHIFGKDTAANESEALIAWERAKAREKKYRNMTDKIKSVPNNFPALLRAEKIMKAAAKYGFEYSDKDEAFDKIKEELAELKGAKSADELRGEGGDALLTVVNYLRLIGVEPETALKDAVNKVARRLEYMENAAETNGKSFSELSVLEREKYWNDAKKEEKRF